MWIYNISGCYSAAVHTWYWASTMWEVALKPLFWSHRRGSTDGEQQRVGKQGYQSRRAFSVLSRAAHSDGFEKLFCSWTVYLHDQRSKSVTAGGSPSSHCTPPSRFPLNIFSSISAFVSYDISSSAACFTKCSNIVYGSRYLLTYCMQKRFAGVLSEKQLARTKVEKLRGLG